MRGLLLLLLLSCGCTASPPHPATLAEATREGTGDERGCAQSDAAPSLVLLCGDTACAFYRREDVAPGRVVRAFDNGGAFIAPGGTAQRFWGSPQGLPGDALPVMMFRWYPREVLPSQLKRQQAAQEWAKRPKEKHHIFPQAFTAHFRSKGINVHDYVIAIDAETHARIHRGKNGGPWNEDWRRYIEGTTTSTAKAKYFEQASLMIQRFNLFGLTMKYWQIVDLTPSPFPDD
jgi:uncharacterized lipoprotein (TIGR02269 family)